MKENTHPNYREVVFQDMSSDFSFVTRSTIQTKETIVWKDGKEYPLAKIEVSSESHPFYTGTQKIWTRPAASRSSARSSAARQARPPSKAGTGVGSPHEPTHWSRKGSSGCLFCFLAQSRTSAMAAPQCNRDALPTV